jgi:hypothetical protein
MDLYIRTAETADVATVQHWLETDTGPSNLVGHYEHTASGIHPLATDSAWVATLDGELVAYAAFTEEPGREARLGFVVRPDRRREGLAQTFITMLLQTTDICT